ncbi:MAG: hypothetical protein K2X53_05330 [Alphaproteobacteria bacterium]|nr:hypothetical protein [Alphaproteobacteria bacterium]
MSMMNRTLKKYLSSWSYAFLFCVCFSAHVQASHNAAPYQGDPSDSVIEITQLSDSQLKEIGQKFEQALKDKTPATHNAHQCEVENAEKMKAHFAEQVAHLEAEAEAAPHTTIKVKIGNTLHTLSAFAFKEALNHLEKNGLKYAMKAFCYWYGYSTITIDTAFQLLAAESMAQNIAHGTLTPQSLMGYLYGLHGFLQREYP